MNPPDSNRHEDFDRLRRLLKLKRHEQPPPGYFLHFSDRVVARLETEGLAPVESWWRRAVTTLWAQPSFSGALGLMAGALLLSGLGLARSLPPEALSADPWLTGSPVVMQAGLVGGTARPLHTSLALRSMSGGSSTTPATDRPSPFGHSEIYAGALQRVSFTPHP